MMSEWIQAQTNMVKRDGLKKQTKDRSKNYLFDILNDIKVYKKGNLLDQSEYEKAFDKFMIIRFLSMNDDLCEIVNFINDFQDVLSKKQLYKLLIDIVPVTKSYDPYVKSEGVDYGDDVKKVAEYYQCSYKDAKEYIQIMGVEWLASVKLKFGITI